MDGRWRWPSVHLLLLLAGCGSASTPAAAPSQSAQPPGAAGGPPTNAYDQATPAQPVAAATAGATSQSESARQPTVDTTMFFANVAVSRDVSLQPTELRLALHISEGPFGELTRRGLAGTIRDNRLLVRLPDEYPISRDPVGKQQRACSYVIDCDSDAIESLGQGELAEHPSRDDLVAYTSQYISSKSLSRGFDIASDVARSREGDCSEHAVLLAAIARRHGVAARVIFGFAVLRFHDRLPILVGHAWTELHDGRQWQLADAALVNSGLERVAGFARLSYLPVQILQREDAGFRAKLVTEPGCWQVERAEGQF